MFTGDYRPVIVIEFAYENCHVQYCNAVDMVPVVRSSFCLRFFLTGI